MKNDYKIVLPNVDWYTLKKFLKDNDIPYTVERNDIFTVEITMEITSEELKKAKKFVKKNF